MVIRVSLWGFFLLSLLIGAILWPTLTLRAEERFHLKAQVINGTSGANPPGNMDITLKVLDDSGEETIYSSITDEDGLFEFSGVPPELDALYSLSTAYGGVTYSITLGSLDREDPILLQVFESTHEADALNLKSGVVILGMIDLDEQLLSIFEAVTIHNPIDKTVMPNLTHIDAMDLVRFSLPHGAHNLDVHMPLVGGHVLQVDEGFAITTPIPPGEHNLFFTYQVPYDDQTIDMSRTFPFGIEDFQLLLPKGQTKMTSPSLDFQETMLMGDITYDIYATQSLPAASSITITLQDLPEINWARRWVQPLTQGAIATITPPFLLAIALGLLLSYAILVYQKTKRIIDIPIRNVGSSQSLGEAQVGLLQEIADLDDRFSNGLVDPLDYQEDRAKLKELLRDITLSAQSLKEPRSPS